MTRHLLAAALCMAAAALFALDNNISNEFWCTYGYVNSTPSPDDEEFDSFDTVLAAYGPYAPGQGDEFLCRSWSLHQSAAVQLFSSFPPVGMIMLLK